ncbi:hypothetical protein [Thiocapsa marina]|uniref:Uncharacterized protein n=1 Tax=Thiocapsa marina 5811 TaxID=768671 RepID=F9UA29_9GAMM|nr:hypothetical protein [Thiocapsa marina]EGV18977.1 hypothetical protein ThimaDRAFT_1781 [Thiocapsa marina 5811]
MDPLSAAFAAYLNTFSTTVTDSMQAQNNYDVQAHVVEHEGYSITFQHRLWKILDDTVCADLRQDLTRYSGCTEAARNWFREACGRLNNNPTDHWSNAKLKTMYCNAAVSYQPTIAAIEWSAPSEPDALRSAREACSLARVAVLGENTAEQRRLKADACGRYEMLKGQTSIADHD